MKFKLLFLMIGMVFFTPFLFAHSPDLSSMMIYEQNGKYFLAIKSSLTAFEGEIDYHLIKTHTKLQRNFSN